MMPFTTEFEPSYREAIKPGVTACELHCVRADELRKPGVIAQQIYHGIDDAVLCIADVTGANPNVLAEYGYARAKAKPVILISQRGDVLEPELPFNIRHLRVITYKPTARGYETLREDLKKSLDSVLGSDESVLREMVVPASLRSREGPQEKFVVAASPLSWREAARSRTGFKELRRTSSDHVGVRGLIHAFGLIYGLHRLPDLVNPGDYMDDVVTSPAHFYCIGSPKANVWTGALLTRFFKNWRSFIEFKADPDSRDLRNVRVMAELDGKTYYPPGFDATAGRSRHDFGFVIRGPHPKHSEYMIMILAGRGALGTEAACRAVTDPDSVKQVREMAEAEAKRRQQEFDFANHLHAFWAVADMKAKNFKAQVDTLTVRWAEPFREHHE